MVHIYHLKTKCLIKQIAACFILMLISSATVAQCYKEKIGIANNYYQNGDYVAAKQYFEIALQCSDNSLFNNGAEAKSMIAKCNTKISEQEARNTYNEYCNRAEVLTENCRFDEAVEYYRKAINSGYYDENSRAYTGKTKAEKEKAEKLKYESSITEAINAFKNEKYTEAANYYSVADKYVFSCKNKNEYAAQQERANACSVLIIQAEENRKKGNYNSALINYTKLKELNPQSNIARSNIEFCKYMIKADGFSTAAQNGLCDNYTSAIKNVDSSLYYINKAKLIATDDIVARKAEEAEQLKSAIKTLQSIKKNYISAGDKKLESKRFDEAWPYYNNAITKLGEINQYDCVEDIITEVTEKREHAKVEMNKPLRKYPRLIAEGFEHLDCELLAGPVLGFSKNFLNMSLSSDTVKYNKSLYPFRLGVDVHLDIDYILYVTSGVQFSHNRFYSQVEIDESSETTYSYNYNYLRYYNVTVPLVLGGKIETDGDSYVTFGAGANFNWGFGYKYNNYFTGFYDSNNEALNKNTIDLIAQVGLFVEGDSYWFITLSYYHGLNNVFNQDYQLFEEPFTITPYMGRPSKMRSIVFGISFYLQ